VAPSRPHASPARPSTLKAVQPWLLPFVKPPSLPQCAVCLRCDVLRPGSARRIAGAAPSSREKFSKAVMRRNILRMGKICLASAILSILGGAASARAGAVEICASRLDAGDWDELFSKGPIVIPAHIIFQFRGHILGSLMDPNDQGHSLPGGGWQVSPAEVRRRNAVARNDANLWESGYLAFMTVKPSKLSIERPCASAEVEQVLSQQWGWSKTGIAADRSVLFRDLRRLRTRWCGHQLQRRQQPFLLCGRSRRD
jgi:hypothetical protein